MKNVEKCVYWGYGTVFTPKVGEIISLVRVNVEEGGLSLKPFAQPVTDIGPIIEIEQIGRNMSILWMEDAGYAVYWTET